MALPSRLPLAFGVALALALSSSSLSLTFAQQLEPIRLGILIPYPTRDNAVPVRLANEWISAVRVSLEVLGARFQDRFTVEAVVQNSDCSFQAAADAARVLVNESVVGVVGPACSEAVKGANTVFGPAGIPFISFAATLDEFSADGYANFFRTVHADTYQAAAMAKVVSHFKWQKALLFYTDEAYGTNLKDKIKSTVTTVSEWTEIRVPYPPPSDPSQYLSLFVDESGASLTKTIDASTITILAVTPNAAEGIWKAALADSGRQYLKYPWWYLGTDGVTALDLVEQAGDDLQNLTFTVQGQIGLAPYKGNYAHHSPLMDFVNYWSSQPYDEYPGLLTLPIEPRFTEARPYVTNLIDAIWTFFFMFDKMLTIHHGRQITSSMLLDCLRDTKTDCAVFSGVSGTVGFNPTTGDRRTDLTPARYDFVNLINVAWAEKSSVYPEGDSQFQVDTTQMMRPGPFPRGTDPFTVPEAKALDASQLPPAVDAPLAPGFGTFTPPPAPAAAATASNTAASSTNPGLSGGAIFGIVLLVLSGLALIGVGAWFLIRRHAQEGEAHTQFVRML